MDQNEARLEVRCANEGKVIGHLEVPKDPGKKGFLLSSRVVWAKFRPVTEDYRLPAKMQGDGHVLQCSRCGGVLCLQADTKALKDQTPEHEKKREEARRRAVDAAKDKGEVHHHMEAHGIDPGLMPITLGKTRLGAVR